MRKLFLIALLFCGLIAVPLDAQPTKPAPRNGMGLAYDSSRDRLVLFGGSDSSFVRLGDTWEWDGTKWAQVTAIGPAARSDFAMTFDSKRGRVVLFGGRSDKGLMHDTWEFDGHSWSEVDTAGPAPRQLMSMAFDQSRGRTVLFGGSGAGRARLGDTWEWDGSKWFNVSMERGGPEARGTHALVYEPQLRRVELIGGYGADPLGDTWNWNGKVWTRDLDGPSTFHTAAAYDSDSGRILVFGGFVESSRTADLWTRDRASWTKLSAEGPPARAEHRGVFIPRVGFVVFGGIGGQGMSLEERGHSKLNDLWAFSGNTWRRLDH
jgi:hypothetical protein